MQSKKKQVKEGVDDLVMLPKVTEDQIVENIKKRYMVRTQCSSSLHPKPNYFHRLISFM